MRHPFDADDRQSLHARPTLRGSVGLTVVLAAALVAVSHPLPTLAVGLATAVVLSTARLLAGGDAGARRPGRWFEGRAGPDRPDRDGVDTPD
ncbi:hypothetical protein [Haloarcula sp. JP-L23]|uniref:hypothetical protein n=1 Tax=Haloarcula sp. JP-L23 TaxID=2716717 RepID=UPI00140F2777|nr:hypothetical protein G9465_08790 [Haloarcula sp. JP-L23]